MFLCTAVVLVERFVTLQKQTLNESLAVNEDLQATMEELESTNEELQATMEELEATNETLMENSDEIVAVNSRLEESEDRLSGFIEATLNGVTIIDNEGRIEVWNTAAENITGIPRGEALGNYWWDIAIRMVPKDHRNEERRRQLEHMVKNALRSGIPSFAGPVEFKIERIDGATVYIDQSIIPLKMKGGVKFGVNFVDTTQRRLSEEALRESEAKYRSLSAFNEQLNSISISFAEASTVEDLYRVIAESHLLLTGAIATTASRYDPDSGEIRIVAVCGDEGLISRIEEVLGSRLHDLNMTVPREIAAEMLSQVMIISDSLELLSFGRISREETDAIMGARGRLNLLGLALHYGSELVGTTFACMSTENTGIPDEALKTFGYMAGLAVTRKNTEEEILRLNKDLERKVALRTGELTRAYEDLMTTNRDLEKALGELNAAQHQLIQAEKLAALGQLTAGIAHELNTPLGAIVSSNRSMIEIMRKKIPGVVRIIPTLDDSELAAFTELFDESIINAAQVGVPDDRKIKYEIAGLLDKAGIPDSAAVAELVMDSGTQGLKDKLAFLLKIEKRAEILSAVATMSSIRRMGEIIAIASDKASRVVIAFQNYLKNDPGGDFSEVRIPEEIETLLTLYQNKTMHGVTIVKKFTADTPVFGNRDKLNQVWMNLLNNALHAMDFRGTIEITTERENGWVIVSVADSGPGIPDAIRARIFEPFFTTKGHGEGMGLGLDISKKIVERHGGKIEFDSAPGRTVFRVRLKQASP